MPAFLDFLFPYGKQEYAQDFHFGGFRHETRLTRMDRGLEILELGRSGRDLRLCYSLKSVERSERQREWPWSIRQTAIYHSFDVETSRATWIVVKADHLMKDRIMSATEAVGLSDLASFETLGGAFASTLATHLMFCEWSGENWRWYINFLEEALQNVTRQPLSAPVDLLPPSLIKEQQSASIYPSVIAERSGRILNQLHEKEVLPADEASPSLLNSSLPTYPALQEPPEAPHEHNRQQEFSFNDLQRIHYIEEKANESLLVLKINISVIAGLKQHYQSVISSKNCPEELRQDCNADVDQFENRLSAVANDMRMQEWSLGGLLRLVADRKALVRHHLSFGRGLILMSCSCTGSCNIEIHKQTKCLQRDPRHRGIIWRR